MRHIIGIAALSLAGLSFGAVASAQRHTDSDSVDRARPDHASIQRERLETSRMSADAQRSSASERYQMSSNRVAERETRVEHPSAVTSALMQRAENRGTAAGDESRSSGHEGTARQSQSFAAAHPHSQDVQHPSAATSAAMARITNQGTAAGDESASRGHGTVAAQSTNVAAASAQDAVQHPSVTTSAAMGRIAQHGTMSEESGTTHDPVVPHSPNHSN